VLRFEAGRELYTEGDEARCFYKVVSGVVRTCQFLSDGQRQIDGFYQPGDVLGIEAEAEHRLSAEAVTDCTLIAYRRRGLEAVSAGAKIPH
jgi:CRP/FNR family nitrogen fixation transcriptional regulator